MTLITEYLLLNSFYLTLVLIFFLGYMLASFTVANRGYVKFSMESFFVKSSTPLVLFIIPIASPLVALSNNSFWWFMGVTLIINSLLIMRAGKMTDIISPGNPGSIVLMVPILATIFGYPIITIIHWLLAVK